MFILYSTITSIFQTNEQEIILDVQAGSIRRPQLDVVLLQNGTTFNRFTKFLEIL